MSRDEHVAAKGKYVVALDCGHTVQVRSEAPTTGHIAQCHSCGKWVGVIVTWRPDA